MTKRETVSLFIKLMGIYFLVRFGSSLIQMLGFVPSMHDGGLAVWMSMASLCAMVFLCILMIAKSDRVAKRLYREDSDESQVGGLSFEEVQILGYSFVGLFLLAKSVPEILSLVASIEMQQAYGMGGDLYLKSLSSLLSLLIQFVLGWILFLRPRGLANLWKKAQILRYKRRRPEDEEQEQESDGRSHSFEG